ncbi:MAG: aminoglycoside phosphotransferase family protein, partial [Rhodocyclaceae bacterium]|nr:aminoglycoside phosphotransferase family protein [Rhodocyclaceae bacterium]
MLEKPTLPDERIFAMLRDSYGLRAASVEFLPLGADYNTAVYRVVGTALYFLKLRSGVFDENSLVIPALLRELGIREIIPVLKTVAGQLWANLDAYTCILYPFIAGRNGFDAPLSDAQWARFGAALKAVHGVALPEHIRQRVPREDWSALWRETVRGFQAQAETQAFADALASKMAAFLRAHRAEIDFLVARAEQLAAVLQARPLEFVLCHYDIHAG